MTTKIRRTLTSLSDAEKWQLLQRYLSGEKQQAIADDVGIIKQSISDFYSKLHSAFITVRETQSINQSANYNKPIATSSNEVTQEFKEACEERKMEFATHYGEHMNEHDALKYARLDSGIRSGPGKGMAIRARCNYILNMKEVVDELRVLRRNRLKQAGLCKDFIQSEYLDVYRLVKSKGDKAPVRELVSLLGKLGDTVGAFEKVVTVKDGIKGGIDALTEKLEGKDGEINED